MVLILRESAQAIFIPTPLRHLSPYESHAISPAQRMGHPRCCRVKQKRSALLCAGFGRAEGFPVVIIAALGVHLLHLTDAKGGLKKRQHNFCLITNGSNSKRICAGNIHTHPLRHLSPYESHAISPAQRMGHPRCCRVSRKSSALMRASLRQSGRIFYRSCRGAGCPPFAPHK
jgi:hypothetical protein